MDETRQRFGFCALTGRPEKINLSDHLQNLWVHKFKASGFRGLRILVQNSWDETDQSVKSLRL